jgi:hypothetical protein
MEEKNKDIKKEEVEVVELFDTNGQSLVFELLSTIKEGGNNYLVLTLFVEDESRIDLDVPANVFVMQQVVEENGEKMLEPVADTAIVEKIFAKFKEESKERYDFADTDSITEKKKTVQEIYNFVDNNNNTPPTPSLILSKKAFLSAVISHTLTKYYYEKRVCFFYICFAFIFVRKRQRNAALAYRADNHCLYGSRQQFGKRCFAEYSPNAKRIQRGGYSSRCVYRHRQRHAAFVENKGERL